MPPHLPLMQSSCSSSPPKPAFSHLVPSPSPSKSSSSLLIPSSLSQAPSSTDIQPGDGFTVGEVEAALHPPSAQWAPMRDYEEADIGVLEPGPKLLTFMGRIVNLYDMVKPSKRPQAAKGCLKLMIGDDTGAMTVRLWYANITYNVRLGQLVTVYTVHVSRGEQASLAPTAAPLFTSIFPERERSTHIMIHESGDTGAMCKRPFGCKDTRALPGLMTLKNFNNGGYDVDNVKVLVCVKSIGARKKFTNKAGFSSEIVSIGVFDDTAEALLTLSGAVCSSASYMQPSNTVLLISHPGWRIDRTTKLSLNGNTRIDIDPDISDARWLKSLAKRLTKNDHVNPPFPEGVFDTGAAETAAVRILYTLADIDEFARTNPKERFMGYVSILITELNIVTNYKRNMLMGTECCGIPIYANAITAKCRQCEKTVVLRINPKIIGPVIDETGQIASGKLIFSDAAWAQFLGRTPEQFIQDDIEVLRFMEQRLLFLRVSLGFGWCLEGSEPLPNDENAIEKARGRKRQRLNVLKQKESAEEDPKKKLKGNNKDVTKSKSAETALKADINDENGEVGRLCIWCVKM